MIDLKDALRSTQQHYRFHKDDTAIRLFPQPHNQFSTRPPPLQELSATTFLKADKYHLSWRISTGADSYGMPSGEIALYIGSYTTPALVYDICTYPEYSIAFEIKDSRNIYVVLNTRSRGVMSIHTLTVHLARDTILDADPLMFKWDMELVSRALKKQRLFEAKLKTLVSMFTWEENRRELHTVKRCWKKVFAGDAANIPEHFQNTMLDCHFQSPVLLATSRRGITGTLLHDRSYTHSWSLQLGAQHLEPTTVHSQYLIWCFPDREIKIALRRDAPTEMEKVRFTLKGNDGIAPTMPWYWIGYNMLLDDPFYNLWSIPLNNLEFINWKDILGVFDQIEEHFSSKNLIPQLNLYDDE
jgi:hypothetical protein